MLVNILRHKIRSKEGIDLSSVSLRALLYCSYPGLSPAQPDNTEDRFPVVSYFYPDGCDTVQLPKRCNFIYNLDDGQMSKEIVFHIITYHIRNI